MQNKNDHDLLIEISTKLTSLCRQFQEVKKENKDDHDKIWSGIESSDNKKLPSKFFYWLMPFIILALLSLGGLASSNRYSLGKIEKAIELHLQPNPETKNNSIKEKSKNYIEEDLIDDALTEPYIIRR